MLIDSLNFLFTFEIKKSDPVAHIRHLSYLSHELLTRSVMNLYVPSDIEVSIEKSKIQSVATRQ